MRSMVSNVLPTWKQRRSKQSFVRIHHVAPLCQIHKVSAQVGFSQPGKLERLFIKCCSLLWTDRACHQMLLHASLIRIQKQHLLVCKLGIHVASHPPDNCHPTGGKKVAASWPREQTKRVLWTQKRGQAFCLILIAGQLGGPSFGSRFRPQKWDRKMQKKGTSLLFEGLRCGALPGVKFCAVYPNELPTALPSG